MLKKIDHIGIAVKDLNKAVRLFRDVFGMEVQTEETVDDYQLHLASLKIGETEIEVLEGTSDKSPISRFIDKRGEGIQHICFAVDDIHSALRELAEKGLKLIDQKPRLVRHGQKIAFLHPEGTHGILVELVEREEK